jgi:kinesin family protein 2/24
VNNHAANNNARGRDSSPVDGHNSNRDPSPSSGRESNAANSNAANRPEIPSATSSSQWKDEIEYSRSQYNPMPSPETDYVDMRIRVVVKKRPLSRKEKLVDDLDVIQPLPSLNTVIVHQPKLRVDLTREVDCVNFEYDGVYNEKSNNVEVYDTAVKGLVDTALDGGLATVFAYGQTGSGKTFTMMGSDMTGNNGGHKDNSNDNPGLYYLAARDMFRMMKREEYKHLKVCVSLFEIYGGKLIDLLSERRNIKCLEDANGRVCFLGLSEHDVSSATDVMDVIVKGGEQRTTGTTSANADSSRSHAVLQLSVKIKNPPRSRRRGTASNIDNEVGRLTFIDLAGSERGADTSQCDRQTRLEGAEINTSLLALKEVIRSIACKSKDHVPFRGSKLTQVLKDSFVGENARSVMVACVAPNLSNAEHTLNTLRYADRVKEKNVNGGEYDDFGGAPALHLIN